MISPKLGGILDPGLAFGKVLKKARTQAGMTQEQLAHAAGVDRTFVSMVERGINQISIRVLFKLASALGLSPTELINLTEHQASLD
jgi:transcriptional regulator with XRE-family HTH domain